jgi:hypothetical protein
MYGWIACIIHVYNNSECKYDLLLVATTSHDEPIQGDIILVSQKLAH